MRAAWSCGQVWRSRRRLAPLEGGRRWLRVYLGAAASPSPEKKRSEDAYFANSGFGTLGVSDGVGGSKTATADPATFSRRLLAYCARGGGRDPATALREARLAVQGDAIARRGGSATALLARLSGDFLEVANFGDCALTVLRPTPRRFVRRGEDGSAQGATQPILWPRPVFKTEEQTHSFNCPFQISAEDGLDDMEDVLGAARLDVTGVRCKTGDVVVAATDGLWDNLSQHSVQHMVALRVHALWAAAARHGAMRPREELEAISDDALAHRTPAQALTAVAEDLRDRALQVGASEDAHTPFERAAAAEGITNLRGGKLDDVTVVLGLVVLDDAPFSPHDDRVLHNFDGMQAAILDDDAAAL